MSTKGIALIAGGGSGIGRETGFSFAQNGASTVVFADINNAKAYATAEESKKFATNEDYMPVSKFVDVTDEDSVKKLVQQVVQEWVKIDYFVNSAGIAVKGFVGQNDLPVSECSTEQFETLNKINVTGTLNCMRHVIKAMQGQEVDAIECRNGRTREVGRGAIVNLSSAAALVTLPNQVQYSASKAAVVSMTKTAALENAPHGIRINAICPSYARTELLEHAYNNDKEFREKMMKMLPLGRLAEVEEVADVIAFLCSPSASYISGSAVVVDAGMTLTCRTG
ncbi:MAG: hypothetical protein M1831_001977 [Alyxoria varia]|nr:MAG: hypothetical protein M1831_001977 [Alyxoria varia]